MSTHSQLHHWGMIVELTQDRLIPIPGYTLLHRIQPGSAPAQTKTATSPPETALDVCPDHTRRFLAGTISHAIDVAAGRRRIDVLHKLALSRTVRASFLTRARAGTLKGATLKSFHPEPRPCGTRINFVGTFTDRNHIRALAGRASQHRDGWVVDFLRLI